MKYVLLVGLMVMMVVKSWGQVKVYTTVDHVTGDTSYETKTYPIDVTHFSKKDSVVNYSVKGYVHQVQGQKQLKLAITYDAYDVVSIDRGAIATFKLATGDTVETSYAGDYSIYSKNDLVFYSLDVTNIADKLKSALIVGIKLQTNNGARTIILTNYQGVISEIISTLLTL